MDDLELTESMQKLLIVMQRLDEKIARWRLMVNSSTRGRSIRTM
jgi:hypothetical protein